MRKQDSYFQSHISVLDLLLICGLLILGSGCTGGPSEFERQQRWLEHNYPSHNKQKTKKPPKSEQNGPSQSGKLQTGKKANIT